MIYIMAYIRAAKLPETEKVNMYVKITRAMSQAHQMTKIGISIPHQGLEQSAPRRRQRRNVSRFEFV